MSCAQLLLHSDRLISNARLLLEKAEGQALFAVVKARAYGHGLVEIARLLETAFDDETMPYLCVARVSEAEELKQNGVKRSCLVLSSPPAEVLSSSCEASLVVSSFADLEYLLSCSGTQKKALHFHFNTGMNRLGLDWKMTQDEACLADFLKKARSLRKKGFQLEGIMSHLACAEQGEAGFSRVQVERFTTLLGVLKGLWSSVGGDFPKWRHLCNSEGCVQGPSAGNEVNAFRPGLHLWGVQENEQVPRRVKGLKPVAELRACVRQIHALKAGESLGYGLAYTSQENEMVATVNLGYADGLRRDASRLGLGLYVNGCFCPLIGRVSMDLCAIRLGDVESKPGDWAYWICEQQPSEKIASAFQSITYELLCSMAPRLERVIVEEGAA